VLAALGTYEASKRDINVATLREVSTGVFKSAILADTRPEQCFTPDMPFNLPSGIVVVVDHWQGQAVTKICSHNSGIFRKTYQYGPEIEES
jgi:hypothetical protein